MYFDPQDAQAAVIKYNSLEKFTISSKPVMVSYIHAGVFVPKFNYSPEQLQRFTFSPLTNPEMHLAYWDEQAYVSELITSKEPGPLKEPSGEQAPATSAPTKEGHGNSKDGENKPKKRKADSTSQSS